jgi:tRNA uridine 5-carboxymethylaminomethyl modification enzyme
LIDDLITKGTEEPYRMFTSRAEYRLMLREDNADLRLTTLGRNLGLVDDERWNMFNQKQDAILSEETRLKKFFVRPNDISLEKQHAIIGKPIDHEYNLFELLRRPEVSFAGVKELMQEDVNLVDPAVREQVEISAKYKGYIVRQQEEVDRSRDQLDIPLPLDLDYKEVHGLSTEAQQKLNIHKPENLGQASRISGITPATISLLLVFTKRKNKPKKIIAKRPEKAA